MLIATNARIATCNSPRRLKVTAATHWMVTFYAKLATPSESKPFRPREIAMKFVDVAVVDQLICLFRFIHKHTHTHTSSQIFARLYK